MTVESTTRGRGDETEIAIIGMACRFPGARTPEEFWRNLRDGVESIRPLSDAELDAAGVAPALRDDPNYVKAGATLEGIDLFDAAFFGFSPREAEVLDPQHRVFLECAWEAIEVAGYDPGRYPGAIGVYAGVGMNSYLLQNLAPNRRALAELGGFAVMLGNDKDFLPTLVSYKLDLRGPSLAVQTGCSTSLVAVHVAAQAVLNGECDIALAGGVSLDLPMGAGYLYQEGMIFSPDGHCRAFDAGARGTVVGSGVGVVVLKRLADAQADGDRIHAVIRGSAVNNDGAAKVGFTAPSVQGQAAVVAEAIDLAQVTVESISFIEAHGTGTPMGDPIEVAALHRVFRQRTAQRRFCALGSVKTNLGHLDTAAGVAGLIKVVLALQHGQIPANLHFSEPNPEIDLSDSPFYINNSLRGWPASGARRAGVSSFGIGGTNAHVVLEEAPEAAPSGPSRAWQVLPISARTEAAAEAAIDGLARHLEEVPGPDLADVAFSLAVGRKAFDCRRVIVARDRAEAADALRKRDGRLLAHAGGGRAPSVTFLFSGQGSQYVGMGAGLYRDEPAFREQVDLCSEALEPLLGIRLSEVLYPSGRSGEEAGAALDETWLAQPALFVVEYALARVLSGWGIRPQAMLGHSLGEYVAACLAGVYSLEDALGLVAERGRLMQGMSPGGMLAVSLSEEWARDFADGRLSLAAVNAPAICVLSGELGPIENAGQQLQREGVACSRLRTSHAFHSWMVEPILDAFAARVARVHMAEPCIPFVSNVTGRWATAAEVTDPSYWAGHLRRTVRFADGLATVLAEPDQVLVEIGPGRVLAGLSKGHPARSDQPVLTTLPDSQESKPEVALLLETLGRLWLHGVGVEWGGVFAGQRRRRVPLPTYPFERRRHWIKARPEPHDASFPGATGPAEDAVGNVRFFLPTWRRATSRHPTTSDRPTSPWLIFLDNCGLGPRLKVHLEGTGQTVITVEPGRRFQRLSEQGYALDPGTEEGYGSLIDDLRVRGLVPGRIVHLWGVTQNGLSEAIQVRLDAAQDRGFFSVLSLVGALASRAPVSGVDVTVVANQLHQVTGEEALRPEKATILGLMDVLPQEHPVFRCRSLDVVLPPDGAPPIALVGALMQELESEPFERAVALRDRQRWVPTVEAIELAPPEAGQGQIRAGGVYLITGGLGRIGLHLAEEITLSLGAKVILTGRTPLPPRDEWGRWLAAHGDDEETSRQIRTLQAIETAGGQALALVADASDEAQMRQAIDAGERAFGPINGVIHAAGSTREGAVLPVSETRRADASRHFAPKVCGALVLESVLRGRKVDFVVLMSSLSTILGGRGLASYAAANQFLDALAVLNARASGTRWIGVDWDGWHMTGTAAPRRGVLTTVGGLDAFRRILAWSREPRVAVSARDLPAEIDRWIKRAGLDETAPGPPTAVGDRSRLGTPYVEPSTETERDLVRLWEAILGVNPIGIHDNFFDLGGNSLLAIQVLTKLRDDFQVDLPVKALFEYSTIAQLAVLVERRLGESGPGLGQLDALLARVEGLSDEDIRSLIGQTGGEGDMTTARGGADHAT
jgi:acyl transferase domain-containing protein/acyl carrier protein